MGIGRYKAGKLDLQVSFEGAQDDVLIGKWERAFRRTSELLYDATDGQLHLERVYFACNMAGSSTADALLEYYAGTSKSDLDGLRKLGLRMTLCGDEWRYPFVILHELGHYLFGLDEEYAGAGNVAVCTGEDGTDTCIMAYGAGDGDQLDAAGNLTPGAINEFCTKNNHDATAPTEQNSRNSHQSCWETIVAKFDDLEEPDTRAVGPAPADYSSFNWVRMAEESRFALVLDRSKSMASSGALEGVKSGAKYWIDHIASTGGRLAVVAYNGTATTLVPLTGASGFDSAQALALVGSLAAKGSTNIGGGMGKGFVQINSPGDRAATQVMILFSDGLHNSGQPPEGLVEDIIESGVCVFTIGFGPGADQARLEAIATMTCGTFAYIADPEDESAAEYAIQNQFIQFSAEAGDGTGVVAVFEGSLPPWGMVGGRRGHGVAAGRPKVLERRAFIEAGSRRASFVLSHVRGATVGFVLLRPDGSVVDPAHDADVKVVQRAGVPYALYVVERPAPGDWTMRIVRDRGEGTMPYKLFAFSDNPDIGVAIGGIERRYEVGEPVRIRVGVHNRSPWRPSVRPVMRRIATARDDLEDLGGPRAHAVRLVEDGLRRRRNGIRRGRLQHRTGSYEAELVFDRPGHHEFEVVVRETGAGSFVAHRAAASEIPGSPRAAFVRVRRFQIHIGPLPNGHDNDHDGDA